MRPIILAVLAMALAAAPATADRIYSSADNAFDAGEWTVYGNGVSLAPDAITWVGPDIEPAQTGDAVVGNGAIAAGVEFEVQFAAPFGYASVSVYDEMGGERLLFFTDHGANAYGIFNGALFGPIPRSASPHHVTLLTPAQGPDYAWQLTVTDLGSGTTLSRTGSPRAAPDPFTGLITFRMTADTGMPTSSITYVRLIGENIVPSERTTWSEVKALYR